MRRILHVLMVLFVMAGPVLAQETPAVSEDMAAWQAAADKRYAEIALEEAESKAYHQQKMRELNLQKAQQQAKDDAVHRERKHAMELREREAALARTAAPAGPACGSCPDKGLCGLLLIGAAIVHLLLAIWVYQDIRKRNAGSGLWIMIVLITGLLGALVYAVVRVGDVRASSTAPQA